MKILNLKVSNWRSIKELSLTANDLMVIIGQNNHGKSNLLSAILFFFGEVKADGLDFNHGATELFVEVEFSDLNEADKRTFRKYVTANETICVRKSASMGEDVRYYGYIENPTIDWLKESNAGNYTRRDVAESLPLHPHLPEGRLNRQHIIDAQQAYTEEHLDELDFIYELEDSNFLGLKTVVKGIFGEVYYVPAVKEASDDFSIKESSAFGRLYSSVLTTLSSESDQWKNATAMLDGLFGSINERNVEEPSHLQQFETELSEQLQDWGASVDIEVKPPDMEAVFKAGTQVFINDGVRTDVRRKGHGLQRALIVALIHVMANRSRALADVVDENVGARQASNSRYFIFEEPELYLHPQAQRQLFDSLAEISNNDGQVILCTHSSGLIDLERYRSIYIMSKESEEAGSTVTQCDDELFENDAKKDFNLSYFINPDRGELFFASKVLLVEGPTEKTVLPILARQLDIFRYDYTLIDCGSKTNIPLYARLLNRFRVPYVAVYDRDHQAGKAQDAIDSADIATNAIEQELDDVLGSSVVFENDFEEELGMAAGNSSKPYVALNHVSADGFVIPQGFDTKLRMIYS